MDNASKSIFESYDFAPKVDFTDSKAQKVENVNRSLNFNTDRSQHKLISKTPTIHIAENKENQSTNIQNVQHASYDYYILKCKFDKVISIAKYETALETIAQKDSEISSLNSQIKFLKNDILIQKEHSEIEK